VLNQFVYQKGGWTLHMLRYQLGTERFWDGIREYYRRYQNQNASTDDLRLVMEQASGKNLSWFFAQWLTRSGVPALAGGWHFDRSAKQLVVELAQTQSGEPYRLSLEFGITLPGASSVRIERGELTGREGRFTFPVDEGPTDVSLDPNTWILMEAPSFTRRER
jgi:aminopeptidase N